MAIHCFLKLNLQLSTHKGYILLVLNTSVESNVFILDENRGLPLYLNYDKVIEVNVEKDHWLTRIKLSLGEFNDNVVRLQGQECKRESPKYERSGEINHILL